MPKEIERKFIIKYLPQEIESILKITQKHIFKDSVCSIRVRKSINIFTKETVYTHTIKARSENDKKYSITELERNITKEEYESVSPFKGSKKIEKYRCIIPIENNLKAEVDVFDGWMKGFVSAEVEFESVEQAENFVMPNWFEAPVSHKEFSNRKLSIKSREEILSMLDKKQIESNKKIFKYVQKIVKNKK